MNRSKITTKEQSVGKKKTFVWGVVKLCIVVCLSLVISLGVMYNISGKSLDLKAFMPDIMRSMLSDAGDTMSRLPIGSDQQVYKWKDAEGVWHFSETAPPEPESKQVESFTLSADVTVIQMPKPTPTENLRATSGNQGFVISDKIDKKTEPSELSSDPRELIQQTKSISEQMKNRNSALEDI